MAFQGTLLASYMKKACKFKDHIMGLQSTHEPNVRVMMTTALKYNTITNCDNVKHAVLPPIRCSYNTVFCIRYAYPGRF